MKKLLGIHKAISRHWVGDRFPVEEPLAGYEPFVMNTPDEIREALSEYQSGRMGHLSN